MFILTENLNFFYRLNKRLTEKNIYPRILSKKDKIPENSIILTTSPEWEEIKDKNSKSVFLQYSEQTNFEHYTVRILAAYRIEYKKYYSHLTFSIDPGKTIGFMIFLDGYYLDSYCCYVKEDFIGSVKNYINIFEEKNPVLLGLTFKFGRGVLSLAYDLVDTIFQILGDRKKMSVLLIDEFKSSKRKLNFKTGMKHVSKDEISALILALRDGIEVSFENYNDIFDQIHQKKYREFKKSNNRNQVAVLENTQEKSLTLDEVAEKVIEGQISLKELLEMGIDVYKF